ncbi:FxDxF family PEP-CTERM protein [Janthinobacterium sp. HLX7-2]|uniref:FxDxF family PEP-CTERM protein n=1 Tax=Janthinobacterium sp. HLX7-2 TaxID=1259331 RepID=UPI003F252DBC
MNMIKHVVLGLCLSASACLAPLASAATWVQINDPAMAGFLVGSKTVTYGTVAADSVWVYDGDNVVQSPAAIKNLIVSQFGLSSSAAASLTLVDKGGLNGNKPSSASIDKSFDYLAIHYNKGELLFHWDTLVAANTVFSLNNLTGADYRAYSSVSAVPEPATYGMLLMGLGLLGFMARRRRS